MNNKLFKLGALLVVLMLFVAFNTFAQLSTVYVDVTNGSNTYTGANATNNPAGTGPKATIAGGLGAVANGGTLIIMAGTYNGVDNAGGNVDINTTTYTQLVAGGSLTIQLSTLLANQNVLLSAGNFIYNVSGGTLNITTTGGTEYFTLGAGAATLTLGGGTNSSSMNISTASYFRLPSGSSIVMNGASAFTTAAPQQGANLSLTYQGGSSITAGPESNYATYGTGSIAVNKTAGTTVTLPNAITASAGVTVTSGNATFSNNVTMGAYDITNSGTGTVTFNGAVAFSITNGTANSNLGSVVNTNTGSIVFNGTATWTAGTFTGANTFAAGAGTYVVDNQSTGSIAFNQPISLVNSQGTAAWHATFTANNGAAGTLTLGSVTAATGGAGATYVVLNAQNTAASGTMNLGGGTIRGFVTNGNATAVTNITGAATISGVITNSGTIALTSNALTLDGAVTHLTNGGTISATSGSVTVAASMTFNGGTFPAMTVNSGKTATFSANTPILASLNDAGTVSISDGATLTVNGALTQTGDLNLGSTNTGILVLKGDYNRTSGAFTAVVGSELKFSGTVAQTANCGPLFQVSKLTFTNTGGAVTLGASIRASGAVTINSGVTVALGTLNIILNAATASMTNNGTYSATGGGGVIIGGSVTIVGGYSGNSITIGGTGLYSYITVDVGSGNTATLSSSVKWTGVLTLRTGQLVTSTFDLSPNGTAASIVRWVQSAAAINTAGGTFDAANVDYDLTYTETLTGTASVAAGASEFATGNIRNLTVSTTAFTLTLTSGTAITIKGDMTLSANALFVLDAGTPYNTTVQGNLTVSTGATLSGGNAANTITLSGDSKAYSIIGTISNASILKVTGNGGTLTGSTVTADAATINNLAFEPTANSSSFTSTNLKSISAGPVTIQGTSTATGATATITMNATNASLVGNLAVGNGTTTPTVAVTINGATTSVFTGNTAVTAGTLTLTRGGNSTTNTGTMTIGANGTLVLGSNLTITGTTSQTGNLNLVTFTYNAQGAYTHAGTGTVTGTGTFVIAATASQAFTATTAVSIPNVQLKASAKTNVVTLTTANLTVTNALTLTMGTFDFNALSLVFTGSTITTNVVTAGDVIFLATGGGTLNLGNGVGGSVTWTANDDFTTAGTVIVNSTGTVSLVSDKESTPTKRTFSIVNLTITAGNLVTGINDVLINGGLFDRSSATAGTWTQTTGYLKFNTATAFKQGTGFAIDNLEIDQSISANPVTTGFSVNKNLKLVGGTLTINAGLLTLGNSATIERQAATALLSTIPTFGTGMNVSYTTSVGAMNTDKELPASVNNLTVTTGGGTTVLTANVGVSGTLTLSTLLDATTNSKTVTMAGGATLVLKANGTTVLDKDLVRSGALNITYDGATATTTRELGTVTSGAYTAATGNVTFKSATVVLNNALTIGGTATFSGGTFDIGGKNVTVQGDVVQTGAGFFINNTVTTANLTFAGATNTLLTLNGTWSLPAAGAGPTNIKFYISKSASTNTVTLSGGDLDFATNSQTIYFVKGILVTGGTANVVLKQGAASGQPTQGFDRSGVAAGEKSHVYGRVKKFINASNSVDISAVTFPVGTLNPNYRPMTYFFKTAPGSSINLTVAEIDSKAGGLNGFPISAGTLSITNYPDFFWYAKSDVPLSPSYKYDLEAQAEGYTDYVNDQIQNVRFVRRDSGSVNNPWILQANQSTTPATILYDNSTIASNWPVVKVIDATGGITSQGSIFAYSQSDKPPAFSAAPGNTTLLEGATFTGTFAAADPDLNQGVTLSVQATTIPSGAYTFNASTGVFTWVTNYFSSGSKTLTVRATATNSTATNDYKDTTITITVTDVPRTPTITKMLPDTTVAARQTLAYTYIATSPDTDRVQGANALKYWVVTPSGATIDSLTGAFSWTPQVADTGANKMVVVKVVDGTAFTLYDTAYVTVSKLKRMPYFTASMAATLNADMGSNVNFTYVAADSDGFALTYAITKGPGTIGASSGAYNYYVAYNVPGTYVDTVTVTASNGVLSASATTIITRVYKNVKPYFVAKMSDGTLFVGDTLKFTYTAADSNGDAMRFYGIQYPLGAKVDSVTGAFFWVAASQQTAIYVIKTRVTDNQGGADTVSAQILVQVVQMNVTGAVTYNGGTVPVNGVTVTITRTDVTPSVITTLTTNTNGAYTTDPNKLSSGAYTFGFSKTGGHPTVYTNAADALKAALYSIDTTAYPLTAIRKLAADVNNDGTVNSADALQIMLRYVGSVTSFAKGDWIFVPTSTGKTLTTADFVNNAVAIAVGDVNGDAQAGGAYFAKANGTPSVVTEAAPALKVSMNEVFEVPVRVKAAASFGSMSLAFQYSADAATFIGVRGPEGMVSAANNGMVAVAWFNAENAMNLKENDAVVTLRFKPTASIKDFSLTLDPNSQMTDAKGTVLSGISLEVPAVDGSIPTAFAIGQNYPNPFNPSTTIQYDLPVAGHVTMVVYNMLGQVVDRLVDDQQNPGTYKIRWDASRMSSGAYLYQITVDAGKQTFKEVRRMVLLK